MKVTMEMIAEICGTSRGTVDRALHGRKGINPKTREKILKVANELGYHPHFIARSLVKERTKTIGMIVFDLYNRFFAQIVNAAEERAKELGYSLYLTLTNKNLEEERRCVERLVGWRVDGIVLSPVNKGEKFENYLKSLEVPIITICNRISPTWPFVGIRDREVTKNAVRFVASRGYQKVIFVCPPLRHKDKENIYAPEERLQGYIEAVKQMGLDAPIIAGDENFLDVAQDNITKNHRKTAIFCSSDIYALRILTWLKSKGIRVPDDVGLLGFDNIDVLEYVDPPLTSVSYPTEEVGKIAVECLINNIDNGESLKDVYLESNIVIRKSL